MGSDDAEAGVGIDDLNLYVGSMVIEATDIAEGRGIPMRSLQRQQMLRRSVAPGFEDPVTMAVNAAKPIVEAAGPDAFELLIVATESSVDYGKPLSSYVHKLLGLPTRCRNLETKHACYAGTAALRLASSWVRHDARPGKKALIITTDMTRRFTGTDHEDFEPLGGAGSVAMSISNAPRVLRIDSPSGLAAREVYDTCRPGPTLEILHGELSLHAYLDLLELAWADYNSHNGRRPFAESFDYSVFHTPLVPLVQKAFEILYEGDRPDVSREEIESAFERMVRPSLRFCHQVGNIYSGSVYSALAGLISNEPAPAPGSRISLYSYGSGSCAEFFTGTLAPEAHSIISSKGIAERVASRRRVGLPEFEAATLAMQESQTEADFVPKLGEPAGHFEKAYRGKGLLVLQSVRDYYRTYEWS